MSWHRKRQVITILFSGGIALLSTLAVGSVYLDARSVKMNADLSRIRAENDAASRLLVALIDIETGVRGYAIVGDPIYLEPFYRGRDAVNRVRADLGTTLDGWSAPDGTDQTLAGQTMGQLMAQRRALMDSAIETVRARGVVAAQDELSAGNAKSLMDRMRGIIAYQFDRFAAQSNELQARADSSALLHSILVVSALALAILFSAAEFALFRNEINGRGAMEQTLRRRNEERRQIAELSGALQLSDSRREAYGVIEAYAKRMLPGMSGAFYVYNASRDLLTLAAKWNGPGDDPEFADHLRPADCWGLRQGGRHTGDAAIRSKAALVAAAEPPEKIPQVGPADASAIDCRHVAAEAGPYTCIPIIGRGQILAMLHLRGGMLRVKASSEQLNSMIEQLVDQLSLSLSNIDLREKLENMALRDGLTGLYNRRFIDEVLDHDLTKLKRSGKQAALLMVDIDYFKRFNDTYGHQAGDEALRRVAGALQAAVRASDTVCRYGGEEFLVFLPECDLDEAVTKAESIRMAISGVTMRFDNTTVPPITASIGLAIYPDTADNRTALINLADAALYRAKGAGRNRVEVAASAALPGDEAAAKPTPQAA